jgi:hypothetical protein
LKTCNVQSCDKPVTPKSARGMCPRHYSQWFRTGSPVKPCAGCGAPLNGTGVKFCSEPCKPRCSVQGCGAPARRHGWCESHCSEYRRTGVEPVAPLKYKWSELGPCLNCGKTHEGQHWRRYCSGACQTAYRRYGGPRPMSTNCVLCGTEIDFNEPGKRGQRRRNTTKFCDLCKGDYRRYKMSARQLAAQNGTACGICGLPVDMTLTRAESFDCPSVDHIVPRSRGGSHEPANLQLAHMRCNRLKSDRLMDEIR